MSSRAGWHYEQNNHIVIWVLPKYFTAKIQKDLRYLDGSTQEIRETCTIEISSEGYCVGHESNIANYPPSKNQTGQVFGENCL